MKNVIYTVFLLVSLSVFAVQGQTDNHIDSLLKKVELIPIMITGEKDNRINIVIMNRWTSRDKEPYNSPKMRDEFIKDINESMIAALTPGDNRAQTAYANYRDFFNVYGLWYPDTPEWKKGIDEETVDAIRDKLFLPWNNENTGWVTFLVMPNQDQGGGGAARNLEKRVGSAIIAGNGIGKMLHEIAHTCMSIGDEYTAGATGMDAMPTYNVETEVSRDKIKWRKWIDPDTPLPTPYTAEYRNKIGAFEGAQYHLANYYRSTAQGCIMGAGVFDNTEKMCPICNQRVTMRVNTLVDPIKSYSPANSTLNIEGQTKLHFKIDHITPIPNTQIVRWILNGKTIASGMDEIDVEFGNLSENELICSLTDESPFIRPDPPYAAYPTRQIKWKIINSSASTTAKDLTVNENRAISKNKSLKSITPEEERIYEAEEAVVEIPGHIVGNYFSASNNAFVDFNGKEGSVTWTVEIVNSGYYPVDIIYGGISEKGTPMSFSVNGTLVGQPINFLRTLPLYTGWAKASVTCFLKEGKNMITLNSTGKSGANIDYLRVAHNFNPSAEVNPMALADGKIKLWFDASDLDGDQIKDATVPERGPVEWKAKTQRFPGKISAKYTPYALNRMGVCGFDNVWVSNLGTDIGSFQTVIMVMKESSMSFPGTCLFRGLNKYLGKSTDSGKRIFDPGTVDAKTKNGKVYLNGKIIDPFHTPNPMKFCILTVEFESEITDKLTGVEGNWEGDIAEMIFIDKTLSDTERRGVEEYLRRKWFNNNN